MIIATLLLLLTIRPVDGGNHPRKEEMSQPVSAAYTFHPPKEWDL